MMQEMNRRNMIRLTILLTVVRKFPVAHLCFAQLPVKTRMIIFFLLFEYLVFDYAKVMLLLFSLLPVLLT